ncbi:MAG: STE24 endopeptidase [Mariniblastus sp.]|jgi:STE24 endopeptidase
MNLLIGFVILLCLLGSELQTPQAVTDCWAQILLVGLVSMTVPGLALFQTLIVSKRLRDVQLPDEQSSAMVSRLSICHSAVWLTASLAIIWAVRWQDVVREHWNLDRWPLLDEAVILAPVVCSLVASWAIFFEIQQSIDGEQSSRFTLENLRQRIGYVSIRFRIYILMAMVPLSFVVLSRDLAPSLNSLGPTYSVIALVLAGLTISVAFPFLLLLIWSNSKICNPELRKELIDTCHDHRLFVRDVRIWKTGNRIVNALVAGMIPKFRFILLSDSLIQIFPNNELLAIVRHEAGHLRLWHLPIRIGFIVLPLAVLAIDEQNTAGMLNCLESCLVTLGLPMGTGTAMLVTIYLGYLVGCLSWLSHRMEYEADIYACQPLAPTPIHQSDILGGDHSPENVVRIDPVLAADVTDALLRLASVTPSQFDRRSFLHPSIRQRVTLIQTLVEHPEKAERFRKAFARRRRVAWSVMAIGIALAVWL